MTTVHVCQAYILNAKVVLQWRLDAVTSDDYLANFVQYHLGGYTITSGSFTAERPRLLTALAKCIGHPIPPNKFIGNININTIISIAVQILLPVLFYK